LLRSAVMQNANHTVAHTTLGRTGLDVGRLGLSASYGMPTDAIEWAFERGANYLYWGTFRKESFAEALRNLRPARDRMVLVVQSYVPIAALLTRSFERALARIGYDHADAILLGMWNRKVSPSILDACRRLRDRQLVRHIVVSTHTRKLIPELAKEPDLGAFHVRYNAVHTGAETDVFPHLPNEGRPGIVSFTATSWKQLLGHRRIPKTERVPTAGDCYRFILSNPAVDVCMTGLSSMQEAEQALAAAARGPLSDDEMAWMRRVGRAIYGQ
jgi:aryl-alcohol dehydrogenase-like predicted oxidoreductase